jgi:colanic acid/amylovoran biosynthesis glycosyltransferase
MQATQPFLVYRDRIGVPSEIEFLRRQYIGFTRLHPVWTGRTMLPDALRFGDHLLRLGGDGPRGPIDRALFRHLWRVPPRLIRHGPIYPSQHGAGTEGYNSLGQGGIAGLAPVLHAQFARGGALALPLVQALGMRMVVTLHGGDVSKQKNWHGTVLARRWPAMLRETRRFVCVSAAVAEIAAYHGVPSGKLIVLPIGVEIPARPPIRRPTAHLFVGRFVEKKGIAVLAEAIRQLRAQGDQTQVVCVGDGPLRPVLETLARDTAGITLTGWLPPDAVRARMTEAIALVVPSIIAGDGDAEGLPSVIPEAMAQACPVIGSDQGGIAEAIWRDQTGLLVPPGDPGALAAAMHRIAHDTVLRYSLGAAGFTEAATRLNARIQSEKLETLLLSV